MDKSINKYTCTVHCPNKNSNNQNMLTYLQLFYACIVGGQLEEPLKPKYRLQNIFLPVCRGLL